MTDPYVFDWYEAPPPVRRRSATLRAALWVLTLALLLTAGRASADEGQVRALAERHFPASAVSWVMRTAFCETGGTYDLDAENPKGYVGFDRRLGVRFHFYGPMQVDEVTWSDTAWSLFGGPLSDPDVSMAMAAVILRDYGRGAWPVCGR